MISSFKNVKIKLITKIETRGYENTNSEVDEREMYELYILSLDDSHKE